MQNNVKYWVLLKVDEFLIKDKKSHIKMLYSKHLNMGIEYQVMIMVSNQGHIGTYQLV